MRQMRTTEEWQKIIKSYKESGKTVAVFCREAGINENLFYRNKQQHGAPAQFVQLLPNVQSAAELPEEVRIQIGAITFHIGTEVDSERLKRLLRCALEVQNA